ncbi:hypothetical protein Prudu_001817 [Prunus dulcis]|uniref:Uncharacterized protein n=1 Tax=Prunus dulcis TaxID=3755 RepID=A0A4Y1QPF3_PRUDU|nr:hypothetical protein Prudu_001817 [Prunus dulcis]
MRKAWKKEKWPGGGFLCTSTAWGRKTFKNVSVTQSQPEPQTGRIQGTVVSLICIPGSHGPDVPKLVRQMSSALTKLKANCNI